LSQSPCHQASTPFVFFKEAFYFSQRPSRLPITMMRISMTTVGVLVLALIAVSVEAAQLSDSSRADVPYAKTTPVRRLLGTQAATAAQATQAAQKAQASQGTVSDYLTGLACDSDCRKASGAGSACGYSRGQCCCRGWTGCYLISAFPSGWDRC